VHRSRLGVSREPLVRELAALEEEFGTILVVVHDRTSARFFVVTAYEAEELPALPALDASRTNKFHGGQQRQQTGRGSTPAGTAGEHNFHQRIRTEKQRFYARVADRAFQIHREQPLAGIVFGGMGVDAGAIVPHLHSYVHDLVLGIVKLTPKKASVAEVREAALALREARERDWERAHAAAVKNGTPTGWAVNGIAPTLKMLGRGQVRTLLVDGQDPDPRVDDAIEDALRQHAQVDVLYDDTARRSIDVLAALLRFRA
jgi:peptide chain release factor subunit 1